MSFEVNEKKLLVMGYGNPGRQDDYLGQRMAESIETLGHPFIDVEMCFQLNIEDAVTLSKYDIALFIDASIDCDEPFEIKRVTAEKEITFTTHSISPGSVMAIAIDHFDAKTETWQLAIRGYEFEFLEGLTDRAKHNFKKAFQFLSDRFLQWEKDPQLPLFML